VETFVWSKDAILHGSTILSEAMNWNRSLSQEVVTKSGKQLLMLRDARIYMLGIKDGREHREYWQERRKANDRGSRRSQSYARHRATHSGIADGWGAGHETNADELMPLPSPLNPKCKLCDDFAWVCEAHPDRPWEGLGPRACTCGGVGMPCEACNPCGGLDDPPPDPPGFFGAGDET
jgi:hypothetical protein